jgi:drug/metabolite transporter (DMT)-like permease
MHDHQPLNTALGIASILLWSTTVALGRSLAEQLGAFTAASLIYLLGGSIGTGYLAAHSRTRLGLRSLPRRYLLGAGSLFALYMLCLYAALGLAQDREQALQVGLLNYLWPILTLLLSIPILGAQASLGVIPASITALAGTYLVLIPQGTATASFTGGLGRNPAPYLLATLAAISWALYSTLSRRWASGSHGAAVPLFMLATGLLLTVARFFVIETATWTGNAIRELLFVSISTSLAYLFWERAMRGGNIVLVTAWSYGTPLLSTAISSWYLGVKPGMNLWLGCGLIIVGAAASRIAVRDPIH